MGDLKETHNVFLGFFFQKHFLCFHGKNPLEITKICLLMGFSRGNTTRRQQCQHSPLSETCLPRDLQVWCCYLACD